MTDREREIIEALRALTNRYIEMMDGGMNDPRQEPVVMRAMRILEEYEHHGR